VVKNNQTRNDVMTKTVSTEEIQRRQEAVNYATASVGLEGFTVDKAEEQHSQRFINGEITLEEFVTNGLQRQLVIAKE
jgi:hypothetical protein